MQIFLCFLFLCFRRSAALVLVLLLVAPGVALAAQRTTPQGWWLDATGKVGVYVSSCGTKLCGRLEWLRAPLDSAGKPKVDIHNPDAKLRARDICGLTIMGGFTRNGDGGWQGGWIYDPSSGNTYKAKLHVGPEGRLHVRGYIGVPLLGRTEVMTRPAKPLTACAPD